MTQATTMTGVLSPVITPFKADLAPDAERLIAHCRWLLSNEVGLAVFGTNSEANSLSVDEKLMLLDKLVEAGVDPKRMMPGTGCCAISDSVTLTKRAVELGCGGALMLPPFYYKGVSDEGLFRGFAEVIERVGDDRLRIYLYHIPPVSQVPITLALIERLLKAYPGIVAGVKDSSGDWDNTKAMLDAFPGWGVFSGNELVLLENLRNGGVGCISATANVNPGPIHRLYANWKSDAAEQMQAEINDVRKFIQGFPVIPSLKHLVAHFSGDAEWDRLRPPLVELEAEQGRQLLDGLAARGFTMPGLPQVQQGAAD